MEVDQDQDLEETEVKHRDHNNKVEDPEEVEDSPIIRDSHHLQDRDQEHKEDLDLEVKHVLEELLMLVSELVKMFSKSRLTPPV